MLSKVFNSQLRLFISCFSFKLKRNGHDPYSKNSHIFCLFGNDGSSSCSCTTTHSGSDKDHFSIGMKQTFDVIKTFFGGFAPNFRIGAGTKAFCFPHP